MKRQVKNTAIDNFTNYEVNNLSSIFGGNSTIGGDLDMNTSIEQGGVINAAIGKGNTAETSIG
ncbi:MULTISPECIES: hypothetical protein [Aquimarina]|uniref:Uncharacterized protein n=1 Tax=Aquimarina algiphila TaxID=2047982 RepID=A0A554VHR8_9FLAO|nr:MULTISPECIES: hypothetical protein [Aquimarina]TSE07022.1 hypothetical protein FOF46_17530 [Aquimarina algiphila]